MGGNFSMPCNFYNPLQNKWTALHLASDNGHDEVVGVLLAAEATVNTWDKVS